MGEFPGQSFLSSASNQNQNNQPDGLFVSGRREARQGVPKGNPPALSQYTRPAIAPTQQGSRTELRVAGCTSCSRRRSHSNHAGLSQVWNYRTQSPRHGPASARQTLPRSANEGIRLYGALMTIATLLETIRSNLRTRQRGLPLLFQQLVYTEHYDSRKLDEFFDFLSATGEGFVHTLEAFLKRRERLQPSTTQMRREPERWRIVGSRTGVRTYAAVQF
jgi:hypothetical protein